MGFYRVCNLEISKEKNKKEKTKKEWIILIHLTFTYMASVRDAIYINFE